VAAALSLREAMLNPGSLTLLLSRSQRQSGELFKAKVLRLYNHLGRPLPCLQESALQLQLSNGSRIISLPGRSDETLVGYSSVNLLVIDEAARVPDALYYAVRPMLAVSKGKLVCLSSAYAQQGFFYSEWTQGVDRWRRESVKAVDCDRIDRAFLEEERAVMGGRLFSREYENQFMAADDAVFDPDSIARAMAATASGPALF
jgi:hypothetical protein